MEASQIYVLIAIFVLAIIAIFIYVANKNKKREKFSKLSGLAFGFVLAGIIFGETRIIGYGLMGIGILVAIIDIFFRMRKKKH